MIYLENDDQLESYFRAIVLFGRNVASYKFALAKALVEINIEDKSFISLEELAEPFSKNLVEHVKSGKRQTVSNSSKFIYACKLFSEGKLNEDELIDITERYGFNNVIDAFHNIDNFESRTEFFKKDVVNGKKGIVLTDELYKFREHNELEDILKEIEGRWNLVETSWEERNPNMIIEYDIDDSTLFTQSYRTNPEYLFSHFRTNVTSARYPLSGYQKGKCFYCFKEITHTPNKEKTCDVDHFFPLSLQHKYSNLELNLNGIWNLVLSCPECNRGERYGKFAHTPGYELIKRLEKRNNYYIYSKHPLGHTIMKQIGSNIKERRYHLNSMYRLAKDVKPYEWYPREIHGTSF